MAEMERLFDSQEAPSTLERDPILEMVCALSDPIIVFPAGGWEHDLPEPIRRRLPLDRLVHVMRAAHGNESWDECCDTEALLYLYPRTMAAPLDGQWSRIYLYLGSKVMGDQVPSDIRQAALDEHDLAELRKLKRWIQQRKLMARKERERKGKAQLSPGHSGKDPAPELEYKQLSYF